MVYEDFTTYTEVDPNSNIGLVGTNHIDHYNTRTEDAYLYKDKGAGYFTDFEHLVDARSDFFQTYSYGLFWVLSNVVDDFAAIHSTGGYGLPAIAVFFYNAGGGIWHIRLLETDGNGNWWYDSYSCSPNTWYYLTIEKTGTALTCKIYSDSARTTLLDTLSLTLQADHDFRYVFGCDTYHSGSGAMNVDIENLDLREQFVETQSPSSCSGAWTDPTNAYADGGGSAYSSVDGDQELYSGYGFNINPSEIISVKVRLDAWTAGNEKIKLYVSEDGGATWLGTTWTSETLPTGETTFWVDITSWTTWTKAKINYDKIWVKVEMVKTGAVTNVYLDWIPIEVVYVAALPIVLKRILNLGLPIGISLDDFSILKGETVIFVGLVKTLLARAVRKQNVMVVG